MDSKLVKEGSYKSNYWSLLPQILQENQINSNWLHIFVKDGVLQNAREAATAIQRFNNSSSGDVHSTIDSFIGLRVILKTFRDWFTLIRLSRGLQEPLSNHKCNSVPFWNLFVDDWKVSFYGKDALQNILFMNLFDKSLAVLPKQKTGVYLQENQGWERSLIHCWNKFNHHNIYGYPHSTIRDWDLRYFNDPRSYSAIGKCCMPIPTSIAVNGNVLLETLVRSGYPADNLVEVEALRYLHLNDTNTGKQVVGPTEPNLQVLVFGGYLESNTHRQMKMLDDAVNGLDINLDIVVKPHPLCNIRTHLYPNLSFNLTNKPISELLQHCDVAYTDSVTSAAVDAYCSGVPVVSERNPMLLNLSPLRGRKGVLFVSDSTELANALLSIENGRENHKREIREFFHTDPSLPRWKKLLAVKYST